jgi:integrase
LCSIFAVALDGGGTASIPQPIWSNGALLGWIPRDPFFPTFLMFLKRSPVTRIDKCSFVRRRSAMPQPPCFDPHTKQGAVKAPVSLSSEELLAILAKAKACRLRDWVMLLILVWHGLRASELVRSSTRQAGLFFSRDKAERLRAEMVEGAEIQEVLRRIKGKPRICFLVVAPAPILKAGVTFGAVAENELTVERLKRSLKTVQDLHEHDNPLLNERAAWQQWLREAPQLGKKGGRRAETACKPLKMQQNELLLHFDPAASVFRISRSQLFRLWQRYAKEAGLPLRKRHPHCAKHTIATLLVDAGVPLPTVQVHLGHASLASTGKYTLPREDEVSRAVGKAVGSFIH